MNYNELKSFLKTATVMVSDEVALKASELYPLWRAGEAVCVGDRRRYEDTLYKCIQSHTSQTEWHPEATPALWVRVLLEEYPAWKQPSNSEDAYNKGDKVTYDNQKWASDINNNVWEPSVYGWSKME